MAVKDKCIRCGYDKMIGKLLCKFEKHKWSETYNGVKICGRCHTVDKYDGADGLFRLFLESSGRIPVLSNKKYLVLWTIWSATGIKDDYLINTKRWMR